MKQTKRPLTPAELDRLWSQSAADPVVRSRRGKVVVGPRELEMRRLREERAAKSLDKG